MGESSINLKQQVFTGLRYNSAAKILDALFAVSYGVFMARILGPSVYGILAMASIFTGISALLIDFGTGDAIIRHDEDKTSHEFLSSIFWLNALIGLFISIIFILLSGFIANIFGHEIIKPIIIINSINIVFSAMTNVPRSIIRKRMDFKSIFLQRAIILPISGVIGIWLAMAGYGIWSLVVQQVIFTTVGSFLFLYYSKWIPRFFIESNYIMEIFHFSSYLSLSKFVNYFTKKGDLFLIGKFLGDFQLGVYSKGYQLTIKMLKVINGIILGVLFPSISKIKNEKNKLKASFLDVSQIMFSIYGFIALLGFLFSKQAVNAILGEKWDRLSLLIPIFLLIALFFALGSTSSHFLKIMGKTKLIFKIFIISSIVTIASFIIGLKWGVIGVAVGYQISSFILFLMLTYSCIIKLEIKIINYIKMNIREAILLIVTGFLFNYTISEKSVHTEPIIFIISLISVIVIITLYHVYMTSISYKMIKFIVSNSNRSMSGT